MLSLDNNTNVFLALIRAGLWERDVRLLPFNDIDFAEVFRLAEEQSVLGLLAAGLEHVADVKLPKEVVLSLVGQTLHLEQRNRAMNRFIAEMVGKMRQAGIYTVLVKGQGIAQCYEKPLWRACGDVDFVLDSDHYEKAKAYLMPMANSVETESYRGKHLRLTIGEWVVELHGHLYCGLSNRIDKAIDEVLDDVFQGGNVRSWMNGGIQVFLPAPDSDVILIFTHYLKHFYKGGLGLRQICDWCRLLWVLKGKIDVPLLEKRLRTMGLITTWKAFAAFSVDILGMPIEAMPFYDSGNRWKRKALKICSFMMRVGNMGHNRTIFRHNNRSSYLIRKASSFYIRCIDAFHHLSIFPLDTLRFFPRIVVNGVRSAVIGI